MTGAEVVPFGKYKGQPVEALVADSDYCEWLVAQPWFSDRYRNVYNVVINYGTEPQDSPEHNAMQARFLDDDWCLRVAACLHGTLGSRKIEAARFEVRGWDVVFGCGIPVEFLSGGSGVMHQSVHVECKPDLGDDYPAVLRQVQRYMSREYFCGTACVLVRRHAFQSVTWEQVQKIFTASHVRLIAEGDVEGTDVMTEPEQRGLSLVKKELGAEVVPERPAY